MSTVLNEKIAKVKDLLLNDRRAYVIIFLGTGNWGPSGCGMIVPTFLFGIL